MQQGQLTRRERELLILQQLGDVEAAVEGLKAIMLLAETYEHRAALLFKSNLKEIQGSLDTVEQIISSRETRVTGKTE